MMSTTIEISEDEAEVWSRLAQTRGISLEELVRQSITFFLDHTESATPYERGLQSLLVLGKYSSGSRDTAGRHDDYLDQALADRAA
jgi:hypothetical protein